MQYKGLEITAFEHGPGQWRAKIVRANGRPLKTDDQQLLESLTSANLSSAVDVLMSAMEAIDAAGLFFGDTYRGSERFWRVRVRAQPMSASPLETDFKRRQ